MKNFTSLLLAVTILLFCYQAEAQKAQAKKSFSHSVFGSVTKEKVTKKHVTASRNKKETQKKLASYVYIEVDMQTGALTDTSEKYVITWGTNGLPTQILVTGSADDFIEGETVPFRLTYTNFVKVNSASDFQWFDETFDFEAKSGLLEVYYDNAWQNFAKNEKTISAAGFVQEFLSYTWIAGGWVNKNKETYTYDAAGRTTESLIQVWESAKWENESRWLEFYDADGRSTGYEEDMWENNTWFAKFGTKLTYTKNSNNQIVTALMEQVDENGNWVAGTRQNYEWSTAGVPVKATEQNFVDGEWQDMTEYRDIKWKSFDANYPYWGYPINIGGTAIESYDSYYYNSFDDSWSLTSRILNIYSGDKIIEGVSFSPNSTEMDTMNRTTYSYYPNGDMKETKVWYKNNGEWAVQYGYGNKNTYDNDGDITTNIGLTWDMGANEFTEQYMEQYTYATITVGISQNNKNISSLNIYPNPVAGGNMTLVLASNITAYISVFDNTGRLVKQVQTNTNNTLLDVTSLPKGIYILNVNQNGKISNAQFIVN